MSTRLILKPKHERLSAGVVAAVRHVIGDARRPVALHEPEFRGRESDYLKECIDSGWVSSVGSYVDRFEAMLKEFTGAGHAVVTVNGTAALHVCLLMVGVRAGDEVLVPGLTFVATANAVTYCGARPHFVDVESDTLGVCVAKLEEYLRSVATVRSGKCVNRQTGAIVRAIVPMHTFGHPMDLDGLVALCERWRLALVEDAAESLGSRYRGRHTGNFGRVAALSFNGNKIVTTGGGGAILTNDPEVGRAAKHLTTTARVAHQWSFIHDQIGFNYRLPNLNAALGCAQLEQLPGFLLRKRELARRYSEAFAGVPGVKFVVERPESRANYWLNAVLLDEPDPQARDAVLRALNDEGFQARPAWTPMHRLPMYRDCPRMSLQMTEDLEQRIVNLPSSARLVVCE